MNKKLDEIHETNKLITKPNIHVMSRFDKNNKTWEFVGYKCGICDQTLKTKYLASKHVCTKSKIKRGKHKDEELFENVTIMTVHGTVWKQKYL